MIELPSMEVSKDADLVALGENLFENPADQISETDTQ